MWMPFGKYRGWLLGELPDDYLAWLRSLEDLREPLLTGVELEFSRRVRGQLGTHEAPRGICVDAGEMELFAELVEAGYRATALKHHPDRGGSVGTMQRVNGLMEDLRRQMPARKKRKGCDAGQ